ncbi:amidohydrolase [Rhodovulum sp. 12E13]|uniref:amidohydrolase n=1 Tax=Rhodovulum sp. 12E13 TaxID=2203891 RepID=UPI000E11CA9D|nr:amidohydrolase [Rhodovulum sp. 12E13]RDC75389.1 amidohydrolase [Rhodovulum sp. 12E13]
MPAVNRIAAFADDMAAWRRHLHAHPELGFDCHGTAGFVAERLREFGVDAIHEGIATSGVVAVIEGARRGPTVGLRADMDALPISEATGAPHASTVVGRMHACGHDGHTAMLLGAARYLAETRAFSGRVALIFQPAEEAGGGGGVMVEEGIMERFGIAEVYALHTAPGLPEGHVATRPGPFLAAVDTFFVHVEGTGGHAATPHETRDPIPAALAIGQALPTIVSRNRHAADEMVLSLTQVHAGTTDNVVPAHAMLNGTVRSFDERLRDMVERRMGEIVAGTAAAHGVGARLDYIREYPVAVNDPARAAFAAEVAAEIASGITADAPREMGAEDFAYMLAARPGAFLFLGQGDGPGLHQPGFDFNDAVAPVGASLLARLVERALPL